MKTPKAPAEDPKVVAAREAEQARAEAARTEETQALRMGDTIRRLRRFGRLGGSGGGSVSVVGPAPGGSGGGGGSGTGAGSIGGGGGSGGGGGGGRLIQVAY